MEECVYLCACVRERSSLTNESREGYLSVVRCKRFTIRTNFFAEAFKHEFFVDLLLLERVQLAEGDPKSHFQLGKYGWKPPTCPSPKMMHGQVSALFIFCRLISIRPSSWIRQHVCWERWVRREDMHVTLCHVLCACVRARVCVGHGVWVVVYQVRTAELWSRWSHRTVTRTAPKVTDLGSTWNRWLCNGAITSLA